MRITTTQLAERIAELEAHVARQDRVLTKLMAPVAARGSQQLNLQLRRDAMARAKAEAIASGHSVRVEA